MVMGDFEGGGGFGSFGYICTFFYLFWFRSIITDSISSAAKGRPSQGRRIVRTVKPRVFIYKSGVRFGYDRGIECRPHGVQV